MLYVRTLPICLLLVYFLSAAGCHCFDLIVSSLHAVRPITLSFRLSVNMYTFNVKLNTERHKDKKGIKKAVTGSVSVPVSKTLV